jgi:hypothetical protein
MRRSTYFILFFVFLIPELFSQEQPVFEDSERSSYIIDSNADISNVDFDDDDMDEGAEQLATSDELAKRSTKKNIRVRRSRKPRIPDYSILHTTSNNLDAGRYSEFRDNGLKAIESNEPKNTKAAVNIICKELLTNPVPEVRLEAAKSLGRIKRGLKALHIAIDSDGYGVKQAAYKSIESIGSRNSFQYFLRGSQSGDPTIEVPSILALGRLRSPTGKNIILKRGLKSNDPSVVAASLEALGYYNRVADLPILKEYLKSTIHSQRVGAVRGLSIHSSPASLTILVDSLPQNKDMEADYIYAIADKKGLNSTLALIKIMQETKNENYKAVIEKELTVYRKAFGKYAIVNYKYATLRKRPVVGSPKVVRLPEGSVARIKKETYKRFKARMNGRVLEDSYFLLQALGNDKQTTGKIVEGWVFGAKIKIVSIRSPGIVPADKKDTVKPSNLTEDEEGIIIHDTVVEDDSGKEEPRKKETVDDNSGKEEPVKKETVKEESIEKDQDEDIEDEDD